MGRVIHFEIHSSDLDRAEKFYVAAAGGEQVLDRIEIPGVGQVSYFKDIDGNIFGALQPVAG